jgi:hypothetical protein
MKRQLMIASLLLMSWQVCQGDSEQGRFNVLGPGTDSCENFVNAANPGDVARPWTEYNLFTAYVTGYLTGYNEFIDNTLDIRGQKKTLEIMVMIEDFCREHPASDFHDGLSHVVETLEPYRTRNIERF